MSLGYSVESSQTGDRHDGTSAEEQTSTSNQVRREPHGSVGAAAGHRAIAQSNSSEIAEALFRYTAPEEVEFCDMIYLISSMSCIPCCITDQLPVFHLTGNDVPVNMRSVCFKMRDSNVCHQYPFFFISYDIFFLKFFLVEF